MNEQEIERVAIAAWVKASKCPEYNWKHIADATRWEWRGIAQATIDAMNQWQPIEGIPDELKDGRWLWVVWDGNEHLAKWCADASFDPCWVYSTLIGDRGRPRAEEPSMYYILPKHPVEDTP